jgi:hypothetical protein
MVLTTQAAPYIAATAWGTRSYVDGIRVDADRCAIVSPAGDELSQVEASLTQRTGE